ncbi:unnamed protein product, partial [Ectocarpus sp. 12 AP-2014]
IAAGGGSASFTSASARTTSNNNSATNSAGGGSSGTPSSSPARAAPSIPENIPAERDLPLNCPRDRGNTLLFLNENIGQDGADYPACRHLSTGDCAWTGLDWSSFRATFA